MNTFSFCWTDELGAAIRSASDEPYAMHLVSDDAELVMSAVNQGIDSHLEACYIPDRGDSYEWKHGEWSERLYCLVSPESLSVLVRRLMTGNYGSYSGDAEYLASSICETLDIELI